MVKRHLQGFVGLSLAATLTGCHIPANSPFTGLAQIRPVATPHTNVLPPAAMLQHPGPGVEGPGPGVIAPVGYEEMLAANGIADGGAGGPGGMGGPGYGMNAPASQIGFIGPDGMQVHWDVTEFGGFDSEPLVTPGRYDFIQGAIYRLKLTNIPGQEGLELYPTLEVAPVTPRTDAFLAHNAIPFQLTDEDLDQVTSGNFVTKVVYLPDPEYQELAVAGVETLVSTRLDPGCDPVVEADRRGSILAIIRIGNKDLQSPGRGAGALAGDGGGQKGIGDPHKHGLLDVNLGPFRIDERKVHLPLGLENEAPLGGSRARHGRGLSTPGALPDFHFGLVHAPLLSGDLRRLFDRGILGQEDFLGRNVALKHVGGSGGGGRLRVSGRRRAIGGQEQKSG